MSLDFKEIPAANKADGNQDRFEQFACDFLETIGFQIIQRPFRGADGKKDMIVLEERRGIENKTKIKWLVSCKHKAHSNRGVSDKDEPDISDRVKAHGCDGFLGIYSTSPTATLANKLSGLKLKGEIECTFYDSGRLEREIRTSPHKTRIIQTYFPNSYNSLHDTAAHEETSNGLVAESILEITKTALILLKIEKIKEKVFSRSKSQNKAPLDKLYRFANHSNEKIATAIFHILEGISIRTRDGENHGASIFGFILTFFPSSYGDTEKEERIANGKQCAHIGFILAYDSFIYLKNYNAAKYGLLILKFIYKEGVSNEMPELAEEVKEFYTDLERTLNRPERNDLDYAKELLKIFKDDLETPGGLAFPRLPDYLYKLTEE